MVSHVETTVWVLVAVIVEVVAVAAEVLVGCHTQPKGPLPFAVVLSQTLELEDVQGTAPGYVHQCRRTVLALGPAPVAAG